MGNDETTALGLPLIFVGSQDDLSNFAERAWLNQWAKAAPFAALAISAGLLGGAIVVAGAARARAAFRKAEKDELAYLKKALNLDAPLALVSQERAAELFKFDVGGVPAAGRIYVRHPHIVDRYLAPADFSVTVARAKEAAVRQLASALGAKRLSLVSGTVHEKSGLFSGSVSIQQAAAEAGIRAEFDSSGKVIRSVYSEFGPPGRAPYVPEDLLPWVEADSDLSTMARTRIEGNLMKDRVRMEFSDNLHAGASVAAKVASIGGGGEAKLRRVHRSTWELEVEYWPKS
jgi:hypothetical protein